MKLLCIFGIIIGSMSMVYSEVCDFKKDFIVSGSYHVEIQSNSKEECAQKALEVHEEHLNATGVNWREDGNGKWCSAEFGKIWQKRIIFGSGAFGCLFHDKWMKSERKSLFANSLPEVSFLRVKPFNYKCTIGYCGPVYGHSVSGTSEDVAEACSNDHPKCKAYQLKLKFKKWLCGTQYLCSAASKAGTNGDIRNCVKSQVCVENTRWKTTTGYRCADYAKNKWCKNGGKGSAWNENWPWDADSFGFDARSVCCICGRNTKSDNVLVCGYCYGAKTKEHPCCNTCKDVREAYKRKGWIINPLNIKQCMDETVVCPTSCKTCKAGGSHNGGKPINSNGVCEHFCSKTGYCGNAKAYKTGDDCSGCMVSANCVWKAIQQNECPANPKMLDQCTHDMKHGELCEATSPFPKGLDKSAMYLNNCQPGGWDVYRCNKL